MSFDITLAFDTAEYLNPQLYMFIDTLKDNIPDDTIIHIVTNRPNNDKVLQWIQKQVPTKIYYNDGSKTNHLKSRCKYMFNCFQIETDKQWVMKAEADLLFLKHLSEYENLLSDDLDIVIESENRKIFDDNIANRLWRQMYRAMGVNIPNPPKIQFRENNEMGLILFGTGLFMIRTELLDTVNERWIEMTEKCESWGNLNVHPNEQAMTSMILDEEWRWSIYPRKYKLNPIGLWRDGQFPSTKLKESCIIPKDTICLDYHHWEWLFHLSKYNSSIFDIIYRNKKYIPDDIRNMSVNDMMYKYKKGF